MQTSIKKDYQNQWVAKTKIKLNAPDRWLTVSTFKSSRGYLYTSVQAVKVKQEENFQSESFILFQDYNKTVQDFPGIKRVTDKIISECHNKSLAIIGTFVDEANEFYKNEVVTA